MEPIQSRLLRWSQRKTCHRAGQIHGIYLDPGCQMWRQPGNLALKLTAVPRPQSARPQRVNLGDQLPFPQCKPIQTGNRYKMIQDDTGWCIVKLYHTSRFSKGAWETIPREASHVRPPTPSDDAISMSWPCFALFCLVWHSIFSGWPIVHAMPC